MYFIIILYFYILYLIYCFRYHLYPHNWERSYTMGEPFIQAHIDSGKRLNKPVIMEVKFNYFII